MSQLLQLPWIKLVCAVHCLNSMVKYFIVVGLIYLHNSVVLCAFLVLASCIKLAFVKNLEPKRLWVLAMVQLLYTWAPFKHQRLCRLYCKFMLKPEFMQCVWLAGVCLTLLDVGFLHFLNIWTSFYSMFKKWGNMCLLEWVGWSIPGCCLRHLESAELNLYLHCLNRRRFRNWAQKYWHVVELILQLHRCMNIRQQPTAAFPCTICQFMIANCFPVTVAL
jgi:hypothetical protein